MTDLVQRKSIGRNISHRLHFSEKISTQKTFSGCFSRLMAEEE
jgi:hypothetical protein